MWFLKLMPTKRSACQRFALKTVIGTRSRRADKGVPKSRGKGSGCMAPFANFGSIGVYLWKLSFWILLGSCRNFCATSTCNPLSP